MCKATYYKYVKNKNGILVSNMNPDFIYKIGEWVYAENINEFSGIYCYNKKGIDQVAPKTKEMFELLELEANKKDLLRKESDTVHVFKKVKPIKILYLARNKRKGESMKCLQCNNTIPEYEAKKIKEAGVEPFCSQYCFETWNGVPLPYSKSDSLVDEVINGKYSIYE